MLITSRFVLCLVPVLAISTIAQDAPTFSSNVKVVNVLATVRDKKGNIVNTLGKDDFTIDDEGKPQNIRYFSRETDQSLTLGLLVDTSYSLVREIDGEKRASAKFVDDVVREGKDSVFLIHFDREVELLQDVTGSKQKLNSALQDLRAPEREDRQAGGYPGGGGPGGRGGRGHGGTLLYDSIFLSGDEILKNKQGRKAIIVLTDGVDHGSKMSLEQAIETAQRADAIVYSIYFEGQEYGGFQRSGGGPMGGGRRGGGWPGGGWPGGGSPGGYPGGGGRYPRNEPSVDGKKILERLSRETGGRMFTVSKKQPIEQIYSQIQDELRNQYNLGYTPDRAADSEAYRHIKVEVKQKDMKVQAREGYYPSHPIESSAK